MYFVNSVAYNGLEGAQSREGHLSFGARWELGNLNEVVIITNPLFVHQTADPSTGTDRGFLE
jgi:hypothetical protein